MNKQQAYSAFWSGFGVLAFEENAVPDDETIQSLVDAGYAKAKYPYITYQVLTSDLDNVLAPMASIWDRSTSWQTVDELANDIAEKIAHMTPIKLDNGRMHITLGTPFTQHQREDVDSATKRNVLTLNVEFLASY
jgi:hypothetical protein